MEQLEESKDHTAVLVLVHGTTRPPELTREGRSLMVHMEQEALLKLTTHEQEHTLRLGKAPMSMGVGVRLKCNAATIGPAQNVSLTVRQEIRRALHEATREQ